MVSMGCPALPGRAAPDQLRLIVERMRWVGWPAIRPAAFVISALNVIRKPGLAMLEASSDEGTKDS